MATTAAYTSTPKIGFFQGWFMAARAFFVRRKEEQTRFVALLAGIATAFRGVGVSIAALDDLLDWVPVVGGVTLIDNVFVGYVIVRIWIIHHRAMSQYRAYR